MLTVEAATAAACLTGIACAHCHALFDMRSPVLGGCDWRLPRRETPGALLTFDDGPDIETTPRVLDILDAHAAKAVFFLIGRHVRAAPALARDLVNRGHIVANHTMCHRRDGIWRGRAFWRDELAGAETAIRDATGCTTRWFRPPMGHRSLRQALVASAMGYRTVGWSCRGYDNADTDSSRVLARIERSRGTRDIILLHDGRDQAAPHRRAVIIDVLPRLLSRLRDDGVSIVDPATALPFPPYADHAD